MKRSIDRILTTHTGSLPRPPDLDRMMFAREERVPVAGAALAGGPGGRAPRGANTEMLLADYSPVW